MYSGCRRDSASKTECWLLTPKRIVLCWKELDFIRLGSENFYSKWLHVHSPRVWILFCCNHFVSRKVFLFLFLFVCFLTSWRAKVFLLMIGLFLCSFVKYWPAKKKRKAIWMGCKKIIRNKARERERERERRREWMSEWVNEWVNEWVCVCVCVCVYVWCGVCVWEREREKKEKERRPSDYTGDSRASRQNYIRLVVVACCWISYWLPAFTYLTQHININTRTSIDNSGISL